MVSGFTSSGWLAARGSAAERLAQLFHLGEHRLAVALALPEALRGALPGGEFLLAGALERFVEFLHRIIKLGEESLEILLAALAALAENDSRPLLAYSCEMDTQAKSRSEAVKKAWIKRRETFVPPMKGKKMSEESRAKMSAAFGGKDFWE